MSSSDQQINWIPERIVVPHGEEPPFRYSTSVYQGISGYVNDGTDQTREDTFDNKLFVTFILNNDGDIASFVVIDETEVADASVFYLWHVEEVASMLEEGGLPHMLWNVMFDAYISGFVLSRAELLKTRYDDNYEIEPDVHFLEVASRRDWYFSMSKGYARVERD